MLPLTASLSRQSAVTLENLIVAGSWGDAIRIVHIVIVDITIVIHVEHIRIAVIEITRRQRPKATQSLNIETKTL